MKTMQVLIFIAVVTLLTGCATTVPKELVNAREANQRANFGIAVQAAPAELHVANLALAEAEKSFKKDSDSYQTRDLAYVAERKAQLAEVTASIVLEQKSQKQSSKDYQAAQGKIVTKTKQELDQSQSALAASTLSGERTAAQLFNAEQRAADAEAALAKLAVVKEEPRGIVITLSGSVLFASGQSDLLPAAWSRLGQISDVLLTTPERNLIIEGHTDSQGTDSYNLALSQRRANTVRSFLVRRGYQADRIQTDGLGERRPIADNSSPEGRANNRRVEIVIERQSNASIQ